MNNADLLPSRTRRVNHGFGGTPTYRSWYSMIKRCTDPSDIGWRHYGGKGVTVCHRWFSFEAFLADMGVRPDGMSIDRIDAAGDYEPSNCRWATDAQQNRNRTNNAINETMLAAMKLDLEGGASQRQVASKYGVSQSTVSRASRGITWGCCV